MNFISLLLSAALASQDTGATKAPKSEHQQHVDKSGDRVMGFSHEKTTHHFLLDPQGGVIEVSANDAKDTASRDQIQMHLGHIAGMFTNGNFEAPMLVHGVKPPGTEAMARLGKEITYAYESSPSGGRVTMTTKNKEALAAIHEFLRFQIKDHATADSGKIGERKR
jgi:hypothetical protein